jgi:hypothetical protein
VARLFRQRHRATGVRIRVDRGIGTVRRRVDERVAYTLVRCVRRGVHRIVLRFRGHVANRPIHGEVVLQRPPSDRSCCPRIRRRRRRSPSRPPQRRSTNLPRRVPRGHASRGALVQAHVGGGSALVDDGRRRRARSLDGGAKPIRKRWRVPLGGGGDADVISALRERGGHRAGAESISRVVILGQDCRAIGAQDLDHAVE